MVHDKPALLAGFSASHENSHKFYEVKFLKNSSRDSGRKSRASW